MAGWKRIARGMFGTGLTFGIGIGAITFGIGLLAIAFGNATFSDLRFAARAGVVGFILGVGFSGILAATARRKRFTQLSLPRFTLLGAGAGLIYFLLISMNAYRVWTPGVALWNFLLLTMMGGGAAATTLLVARKASASLDSGDELLSLSEGESDLGAAVRASRERAREKAARG